MFHTTRLLPLTNCKDCLRQAIVVMEWFHLNACARLKTPEAESDRERAELATAVRGELGAAELTASDLKGRSLVQRIREYAVVRTLGTVVYCRARRPATLALEILCAEASVAMKHVAKGFLTKGDFKRFVKAAGRVASAPLTFCDARSGPLQAKSIADLAVRGYLGIAAVDGSLSPSEVAALERVTAEWPVVVVAEHTVRVE